MDTQENNHESRNSPPDISEYRRSSQERKLCYRELLNKAECIQEAEDLGLHTINEVGVILREANSLDTEWNIDDRVEHADETLLDCLVLSSASNILKRCIGAVDVFTSTYDASEFATKMIQNVTENDEETQETDILKLIDDARQLIPVVPEYSFMFGSYDLNQQPVPKRKKERTRGPRERLEKSQPEKVTYLEKEEETIEQIVKELHDVLTEEYEKNDQEPIGYYNYVIDTESFSNTVENMFYFSFLIRDGRAKMDLDGRGEPIIKPVKKKDLKAFRDGGGTNSQLITNISMDIWEKFKKEGYLQLHRKKA